MICLKLWLMSQNSDMNLYPLTVKFNVLYSRAFSQIEKSDNRILPWPSWGQ